MVLLSSLLTVCSVCVQLYVVCFNNTKYIALGKCEHSYYTYDLGVFHSSRKKTIAFKTKISLIVEKTSLYSLQCTFYSTWFTDPRQLQFTLLCYDVPRMHHRRSVPLVTRFLAR